MKIRKDSVFVQYVLPAVVSLGLTVLVVWVFKTGNERLQFLVIIAFAVPLYGFLAMLYGAHLLDRIREKKHPYRAVAALIVWSLMWLAVLGVVLVIASDLFFGTHIQETAPRFEHPPPAPVMAVIALLMFLVAGVYCWAVLSDEDGYWAQRFLDLKVFVLWLLAASYLLFASHLVDAAIGTLFGDSVRHRLERMTEGDLNTIVTLGAFALATAISIFLRLRKR